MTDGPRLEPRRGLVSRWRHRRAIRRVRRHVAALGFPLDHLTDAEIEEGAVRIAAAFSSTRITVAEASLAMDCFAAMVRSRCPGGLVDVR